MFNISTSSPLPFPSLLVITDLSPPSDIVLSSSLQDLKQDFIMVKKNKLTFMIILGDFNNDILRNNCNKKLERLMLKFNLHHIYCMARNL